MEDEKVTQHSSKSAKSHEEKKVAHLFFLAQAPPLMPQLEPDDSFHQDPYYKDEDSEEIVVITKEAENLKSSRKIFIDYTRKKNMEQKEIASHDVVPKSNHSPYLVVSQFLDTTQSFFSIKKEVCYHRSIHEMYGMNCRASYGDWMAMLDWGSGTCILLNSSTLKEIELPILPCRNEFYSRCILTPNLVMFLSSSDCLYCRPTDLGWTKKNLRREWRTGSQGYNITRKPIEGAVHSKGKIYINYGSGFGMKVLEYNGGSDSFTVQKIRFNEELRLNSYEDEPRRYIYMVESAGEVYLVARICMTRTNESTFGFNVYKLVMNSFGIATWKEVTSLGDDTVFLLAESCSLSISASKAGLENDQMYYVIPEEPTYIYRYDMTRRIQHEKPCFPYICGSSKIALRSHQPFWLISYGNGSETADWKWSLNGDENRSVDEDEQLPSFHVSLEETACSSLSVCSSSTVSSSSK